MKLTSETNVVYIIWLPDTSATRHFGPARDTSALVPKCLKQLSQVLYFEKRLHDVNF